MKGILNWASEQQRALARRMQGTPHVAKHAYLFVADDVSRRFKSGVIVTGSVCFLVMVGTALVIASVVWLLFR